jgi:two-component system NarL family sensor kinase
MTTVRDPLVGGQGGDVLRAVARERRRLADALHDTTIQELVLARILVDRAVEETPAPADYLEELRCVLDDAMAQLRTLVWELAPRIPHQTAELVAAIEELCERLGARWRLPYRCQVTGAVPTVLLDALAETLLLAARELMTNAGRHAGATGCDLMLAFDGDTVVLTVCDDGIGIDGKQNARRSSGGDHGYGLLSLRSRTEQMGGELSLASRSGGGTEVNLRLPLSADGPRPRVDQVDDAAHEPSQ